MKLANTILALDRSLLGSFLKPTSAYPEPLAPLQPLQGPLPTHPHPLTQLADLQGSHTHKLNRLSGGYSSWDSSDLSIAELQELLASKKQFDEVHKTKAFTQTQNE